MRFARAYPFLSNFVRGADLVAEYPIHALFFTWSLSVLTMGVGFPTLAGMTLSILGASLMYRWARGPKTLDPEAYKNYLGNLEDNAVTWPYGFDEEDTFFQFHSRQLEYLAAQNRWEHIANIMDSIRQRFPVAGIKGYLSLRLMTYFYKLHAYSNLLHAQDKQALLKKFLKRWLSKNGRKQPSISTGLECASFLRPIYETDLIVVGRKNYNNTQVFISLSPLEQQQVIDHLLAEDSRCLFVLVSLCIGDDRMLSPQLMHDILEKYRQMEGADLESGEKMGQLLMAHLMQQDTLDVSPALAAEICHLYGCGQNIMRSLMKLYDHFPEVSDKQRSAVAEHLISRVLDHVQCKSMPVDQKLSAVMGLPKDPQSFMSELFGEEVSSVDSTKEPIVAHGLQFLSNFKNTAKIRFYYSLFSDFIRMISSDKFGGADNRDGLRGHVFQFVNRACLDLSENIFLIQISRHIGRNITFFLLRGLLNSTQSDSEKKIIYFLKSFDAYSKLQGERRIPDFLLSFQGVAETFRIENGFSDLISGCLELLLAGKNDPSSQQMSQLFLEFVLDCPDEAVSRSLSLFKSVLPINNPRGPLLLFQRFVSMETPAEFIPRLAAMLIFALHPPEYIELYENKSRLFKRTPVLFSRETQLILQAFQRSPDLGDDQNQDICDRLKTFGPQTHWLDLLKNESKCLEAPELNV